MQLRSIELEAPQAAEAAAFLSGIWGAIDAGSTAAVHYVRGTEALPYLVAISEAQAPAVRSITFTASEARVATIRQLASLARMAVTDVRSLDPGGGEGVEVTLPEGERLRFLHDCTLAEVCSEADAPVKLTHVVLNSTDAEASARVCEDVLGFTVSDRTAGMVFVRCNSAHHSIAFARAGFASLNHIAFEMADIDAVMRGVGRMRDGGFAPDWGPGRHGPGDNVFAYFIAPFGAVVEFSTAVETVADDYPTGAPEDWTWPAGRIDQWGMSDKAVARLRDAEKRFCFAPATRTRMVA